MVYFLTEITENDLLNATSGNSDTLPKNSAALESAIPAGKAHCQTITGKSRKIHSRRRKIPEKQKIRKMKKAQRKPDRREKAAEPNPVISYILMGALAAAFIGGAYYFKVVRKKKRTSSRTKMRTMRIREEYENEDEEPEDGSGDDFFENGEE